MCRDGPRIKSGATSVTVWLSDCKTAKAAKDHFATAACAGTTVVGGGFGSESTKRWWVAAVKAQTGL